MTPPQNPRKRRNRGSGSLPHLTLRCSYSDRDEIRASAALVGMTLTEFMLKHSLGAARRVARRHAR